MSKETISRERLEAPPGTIYAETILEPSHLFMLEHYFSPLASTNKAWTVMLVETGIVDEPEGMVPLAESHHERVVGGRDRIDAEVA
jgi:hypothetical protein